MDRLAGVYASLPLLFWVLGSMVLYGLGANALWLLRSSGFRRSVYGRGLVQVGRLLFYLSIPYLALGGWPLDPFQGLLSLEDMGLVGFGGRWTVTRWLETAGTAAGIGLLAALVLGLAWANANRKGDDARIYFAPRPWWALLVDAVYLQVHWAFYRGTVAVSLGDLYAGVFLGLGLVCLEWALNPFWRRGWRRADRAAGQWLRLALALVTALIFFLTRNLWVCLVVHIVLQWIFWGLGRARPAAEPA